MLPREHFLLMGYDWDELGIDVVVVPNGVQPQNDNEWHWHALTDLVGNAFEARSFLTALILGFFLQGKTTKPSESPTMANPGAQDAKHASTTAASSTASRGQEPLDSVPRVPVQVAASRSHGRNPFLRAPPGSGSHTTGTWRRRSKSTPFQKQS